MLVLLHALSLDHKIALYIFNVLNTYNVYTFKLILIICSTLIVLLVFLVWKLVKEKNKTKQLLKQRINYENKVLSLQNSVSNELLDQFGNKLAAMSNVYEIIKDINQTKQQNDSNLEKFWNHFEENYSALLTCFNDMMWANSKENRTLKQTIERLNSFIKTLPFNVNITLQTKHQHNYELPRYWNRQFFLLIKEIIISSTQFSTSKNFIIKIHEYNNLVEVFFSEDTNFYFKENVLSKAFENMECWANSLDAELIFHNSPFPYYVSVHAKIPVFNKPTDL